MVKYQKICKNSYRIRICLELERSTSSDSGSALAQLELSHQSEDSFAASALKQLLAMWKLESSRPLSG